MSPSTLHYVHRRQGCTPPHTDGKTGALPILRAKTERVSIWLKGVIWAWIYDPVLAQTACQDNLITYGDCFL
jgi:hypothetical protein